MKEIQLTKWMVAIVDDCDFDKYGAMKWCYNGNYAVRFVNTETKGIRKIVKLHRLVVGAFAGQIVDHINGNKMDCRKDNLRIVTSSQSAMNRGVRVDSISGLKGVNFNKKLIKKPYSARIKCKSDGKYQHLGYFATAIEAATAYNAKALVEFGEFARLNTF